MRIIPLNNATLFVLKSLSSKSFSGSICLVSGSEDIIYYDESQYGSLMYINTLKDVEKEIESNKYWRSLNRKKEFFEYLTEVKSVMISYIRESKIDSLFNHLN